MTPRFRIKITQAFNPGPGFHYRMIPGEVWNAEETKGLGRYFVRIPYGGMDCLAQEECYEVVPMTTPLTENYTRICP